MSFPQQRPRRMRRTPALRALMRESHRQAAYVGTDNVETRYLVNDVAVKHKIPWVYGACVGTEGRAMSIVPGVTACLRCLFSQPPGPGELPTCDTAGVLAPVANIVASIQVAMAMKLLGCANSEAT